MKNIIKKLSFVFLAAAMIITAVACGEEEIPPETKQAWLSSDGSQIQLYHMEEETKKTLFGKVKRLSAEFTEDICATRGTEVTLVDAPEIDEEGNVLYQQIRIGENTYYIKPGILVDSLEKTITETEKYVRTSVTIYENAEDVLIAGFAKKGSRLDVIGFDRIKEDGSVNMYKVRFGDIQGYVFSKYLVDDQVSAEAIYNENGVADFHHDAVFSYDLYGGSPDTLDWYPCEKEKMDFDFCEDARAMYIGVGGANTYQDYVECAKQNGCTAVVIDIFDDVMGFDSDVAKEYCPSCYNFAHNYRAFTVESWADMVKAFSDAGIYTIGRIVTFKDDYYAEDHPEDCILYEGTTEWPSVFSRDLWEYKVGVAVEAVKKFGFNEIQFDYVRFPEAAYWMSQSYSTDFKNTYDEDKCEAVQNFVFYAADMVRRAGAYVSVDVFGESSFGYVPSYGQYWPAISNIVDAISAMPYTDHFDSNPANWLYPYVTLNNWAEYTAVLQEKTPTPAAARTWITAYDTPYWVDYSERMYYGANAVADQAQGLWDAGLTGGFMTWNIACDLYRYYDISWAWAHDYTTTTGRRFY